MKERGTEHLAKRARSREKRLNMIERLDKPMSAEEKMRIEFRQDFQSGTDVLMTEELRKSFKNSGGKRILFDHVNMDIKKERRSA